MKKLIVFALTMVGTVASATDARAHWFDSNCYRNEWLPFYPPQPAILPVDYATFKPEWREDKVTVAVQRWHCKEVTEKIKVYVMVPKDGCWVPEERIMERRRTAWYTTTENVTVVNRYVVQAAYIQRAYQPVNLPTYGPPVCPWDFSSH